ncbi:MULTISPECIES: M48 family metallopeptidase [unclassified Sphingobium]|uniref:M48 family metallopeptidase n=1 Tax=unclassified Sphingobium TaxID=2611147 RepID=UPI002224DDF5|nr:MULTISPECIES: M48 family metallopeptidase [unclassified Sphingobium]MCW2410820.1 putative metal-dependent hydrolase [Sphingobium sp. B8D3D]MCW2416890.1 putative metal-dependent hydrolase [Sphingobium sp. B8D3A]
MSTARSEHRLTLADGAALSVVVMRHGRARRMKLRFDELGDRALLTIPPRASLPRALDWVRAQGAWIEGQRGRNGGLVTLADGALVPFEGTPLRIVATGARTRQVRAEQGELLVGGPVDLAGARVLRWLKAQARSALTTETQALATRHGLPLRQVAIGDPRARWGSCSVDGNIRYSWRLILAPPHVRLATVAHEVAHLEHMHHGPEFHALVRAISPVCPDAARAWLRAEGRSLHRYTA